MYIINKILFFLIFKPLKSKLKGNLIILMPGNEKISIGNKENATVIKIHKYSSLVRLLFFGLSSNGYSYSIGEWETTELRQVLSLGIKNLKLFRSFNIIFKLSHFCSKYLTFYEANTIKNSKKQIHFHYDLGNKFYSKWLDKSMTYSSAIYQRKSNSLEEAQNNKFKSLIALANIKRNNRVLEIGCGWGSFINYVLKNIGSDITGITISSAQYNYAKNIIKDKKRIKLMDYRRINNTYDKIISIEMFEAVGKKNWSEYFRIINKSLKKGGAAALQIITIDEKSYSTYEYRKDFIQKYIFPGGMLPTKDMLGKLANCNNLKLSEHKSFASDYAKTLSIWRQNFLKNWKEIERMGFDDKFKRLWEYYLCYCEVGFKARTIDVSQFLLEKK